MAEGGAGQGETGQRRWLKPGIGEPESSYLPESLPLAGWASWAPGHPGDAPAMPTSSSNSCTWSTGEGSGWADGLPDLSWETSLY